MKTTKKYASQAGFTLVELVIALALSGVIALYAMYAVRNSSEEAIAKASGNYIAAVANAAQLHVLMNWEAYADSTPVAGVANLLQPTVAELVALGRLPSGYGNNMTSTRQALRVDINQTGCPGTACMVTALVCTTTGVTLGGPQTRFDLASTMVMQQNGAGAQSLPGDGSKIVGPLFTPGITNPVGNVEGVVCGSSTADIALYQQFVKIRDTRDPDLQGDLTVTGTVTAKDKLYVGTCINMDGTAAGGGRAGFGCTDRNDLPPGWAGGVRSVDVVANNTILASNAPGAFTGNNGNYAMLTADNGAGAAEIRTSGRSAGDRLTPLGAYAPGSGCLAADEGSISKDSTATGLVTCEAGVWTRMKRQGTLGQACSPDGVLGETASGVGLYCQSGFWVLLADRFGRFAVVDTFLVYDNSKGLNPVMPVPNCPTGGFPKVYFNPQGVDARSGSKVNYRVDITTNPGFYTVHIDDSVNPTDPYGTVVSGYGLLNVGCFYN